MTQQTREISIEFEEIVVVRRTDRPVPSWCEKCGERVPMLVADQAARVAQVSARTLFRWVEAGRLHFIELKDGSILICSYSLGGAEGELHLIADRDRATAADDATLPSTDIEACQKNEGEL